MLKKTSKNLLVVMLGLVVALTTVFGIASFDGVAKVSADGEKAVEDIIDLSKGPKDGIGQPNADAADNALKFHFKNVNMSDGSWMENLVGDYIVVTTTTASKTITQWSTDSGKRAFRVAVYGGGMYVMCENGVVDINTIQYVTFKAGFCLYQGTAGTEGDWVFSKTASTKVEGTDFATDLKLYVNRSGNVYQYATSNLTVATAPAKTVYTLGETFDPAGMTLTAVTETSGTKTIEVTSAMCSAALSSVGEKTVTVSYGGKTVSTTVTVAAPAKVLTGIEYKSGSVSIEQNGSASEMTLNALKLTATYEDDSTAEIDVTADMISVDPAMLGSVKGKVSYTENNVTKTCEINVTVTERTSEFTVDNMYLIPIDGYYAGEDGGALTLKNSGINIWFTTNAGYGAYNKFDGLAEKWYSDGGFEAAFADIKAHVLLNGKTFDQLNAENAGLARYVLGYYAEGLSLRVHTDGAFQAENLETVTLLKGFRMYDKNAQALGAPTPCDYTFEAVTKPGTSDKMLVRKTESITVESAPAKVDYDVNDKFDVTGMSVKAVYTDGGVAKFAVKDRMVDYDFTSAGEKNVTVTYNGKTATQNVTVTVPPVTVTSIAVKEGVTLSLKQYSLNVVLSAGAKIVVTYSDNTTQEKDLTLDMIGGYTNQTVGSGTATVTYGDATCDIAYTVAAYDGTSYFGEIEYKAVVGSEGTGYISINGIKDITVSLKALWDVDKAKSLVMGKTVGDFVTINGKTVTELVAAKKVARMLMYGSDGFGFHIDDAAFMAEVKKGAEICLLPGFTWVTNAGDAWGAASSPATYVPIENAVVTKPLYFCLRNNTVCKVVESISLNGTPKTDYYTDDAIDVNGLTLTVKYKGFADETIDVTAAMCDYDFSATGEQTVTVSYGGKEVTFKVNVTVAPVTVTSIAIKEGVTLSLKQYSLNVVLSAGAKIVVTYSDNTAKEKDLTLDMITGYTNETVGSGNATVTYLGKTCNLAYTVAAYDGESYFTEIDYTAVVGNEGTGYIAIKGLRNMTSVSLKALWTVDKAKSLVMGKTVGDFVTINGKTVTELVAAGKVARMLMYGADGFGFHIDDAAFMSEVKNGAEICLLPGFTWVTNSADAWGAPTPETYEPIENAVVTKHLYFCLKNNNVCKVIESVALNGTPKANYYIGDAIDVTGLTLSVKYKGFDAETVDVTSAMCDYDFSAAGEQTVTISYDGKEIFFKVNVSDIVLTEVYIESEPTKKEYDFALDKVLDLAGFKFVAKYSDSSTQEIAVENLVIEGFNSRVFGSQVITVKYGEMTASFEIEVKNISKNKYLGIDYASAAPSYEASVHKSIIVYFTLNGVYESLRPFWGADKLDYVAEYMLINGKKVSELIAEGKVTRLAVWTNQLVIHLDTNKLVPATWVDKRSDPNDPNDKGIHYVEGESEVVETITFLPGFQWYTMHLSEAEASALWGNDNGYQQATPIEGAVLKEEITIYNNDGYGWSRPLLEDENGNISSDALTIVSLPNKTTYTVGEKLELRGIQIRAKYQDGGEEIIVPAASDIEGYNRNQEGKQTLTFTYFGQTVSFEVTVQSAQDSSEEGGCKSSVASVGLAGLLALLAVPVFVLRKKKNEE